jgi:hypothetical protein
MVMAARAIVMVMRVAGKQQQQGQLQQGWRANNGGKGGGNGNANNVIDSPGNKAGGQQ